ncbi:MAG: hypothetical protein LBK46_03330 [Oscillospiraceae bacterium]|jgi:hypothetical protein|nr:hypothetical protein [Oscillospiraceae bacterium]
MKDVTLDNRCTLYISSCDAYSDLWKPFFTLFAKYWPDCPYPIVLASETKTFSFPGLDIQCPRFYKPGTPPPWGELNIRTLESINSPFIFFMLDDFFIFQPVDQPFMDRSIDWMENDSKIGRFQWRLGSRIHRPGKYAPYAEEYIEQFVRVCAFPAIWRRDLLIRSILPHENPWQWEIEGTKRSKRWPEKLYSAHWFPIKYPFGGALCRGKWSSRGLDILKMNDISIDIHPRGYAGVSKKMYALDEEIRSLMMQWERRHQTEPAVQQPEQILHETGHAPTRAPVRAANPVPRRRKPAVVRPRPPRPPKHRSAKPRRIR